MTQQPNADKPEVSLQNEIYTNAVDILVFPNDFIFQFGRYIGGPQKVINLANAVMSPQSAKKILERLQDAVDKYEEKYGEIRLDSLEKE